MLQKIFKNQLPILVLLLLSTAVHGQQPLGIITIDFDGSSPPPRNSELVSRSLSAAFADTLKKKLNVNDPGPVAELQVRRDGPSFHIVIMSKGAAQPTPDEVLGVVRESFLETVSNLFNDLHQKEIRQMRELDELDVDLARRRMAEAQEQLAKIRITLRQASHRVEVSPDALRSAITRLEDDRDKLALDSEAMAIRRKAVGDAIAEITLTAEKQIKSDRIVVELQKLVDARMVELKRMQQLAADKNVSQADLEVAETKVGEARVRLWERQEIINRTAGGELLADLNKELAMLSINMAESQARLERVAKAVDDYAKAVDLIDGLESAQASRQAAQQSLLEAESHLAERVRSLRQMQPPSINLHARPQ